MDLLKLIVIITMFINEINLEMLVLYSQVKSIVISNPWTYSQYPLNKEKLVFYKLTY